MIHQNGVKMLEKHGEKRKRVKESDDGKVRQIAEVALHLRHAQSNLIDDDDDDEDHAGDQQQDPGHHHEY